MTTLQLQGRWLLAKVVSPYEFEHQGWLAIDTITGEERFVESAVSVLLPSR